MRFSATLLIAAALAFSANAASIDRRDLVISPPVALCIADLVSASEQLAIVKTAVDGFFSSAGYSGALAIHNLEQVLETRINKAKTDCCAVTGVITSDEATGVLDTVGLLVPKVVDAITSINGKKSQFDAIFLATSIVKTDLKNLEAATKALDTCLVNKTPLTPPEFKIQADAYVATINASFLSAKNLYKY
ncbi:hypothetical protein INT48_004683 [Thamnidium elegans]|uniref:Uncharacterized protein n=1 Tax=Thamnidium elegans TaxID=101142 RepID=A0A8H7SI47_9FUNG|nr:hypothetical protein INT48_004683 [Thamnidium elegans]